MSEVQDAVQIILMYGRVAALVGKVSVKSAMLANKIMMAVYLSKWRGKTGFNRLLKIKGEQNGLTFVNIGIEPDGKENRKIFREILKEFDAHGILYAVMPDLCAGDGATQIAVSNVDVSRLNALLIDHKNGRHGDIQLAEITQFDYAMTGVRGDGSLTHETEKLLSSARKKVNRAAKSAESFVRNLFAGFGHRVKKLFHLENHFEAPQLYHGQWIFGRRRQETEAGGLPDKRAGQKRLNERNIRQAAKIHDISSMLGDGACLWLKKGALACGEIDGRTFHLVPLEDGINAVLVPDLYYKEPLSEHDITDPGIPCGFLLMKCMKYKLVNLETGNVMEARGAAVIEKELKERIKKSARSRLQNPVPDRKIIPEQERKQRKKSRKAGKEPADPRTTVRRRMRPIQGDGKSKVRKTGKRR